VGTRRNKSDSRAQARSPQQQRARDEGEAQVTDLPERDAMTIIDPSGAVHLPFMQPVMPTDGTSPMSHQEPVE